MHENMDLSNGDTGLSSLPNIEASHNGHTIPESLVNPSGLQESSSKVTNQISVDVSGNFVLLNY